MTPSYKVSAGVLIGLALIGGLYHFLQPESPRDYLLPHDDFDQKTLATIHADLAQYNVQYNPQDHEVYMVTGGLGLANPRIMFWDSDGNMDFGGNEGTDATYSFKETSASPAKWYTQHDSNGVGWTNGPEAGYKPVPWKMEHTKSGVTYYKWDTIPGSIAQYYFKKGNTYIVLRVDYTPNESKPTFPQGLLAHLVAVGNPVAKPKQ